MADLVLWETCRCCSHFSKCSNPFASSGVCPHPTEARRATAHPYVYQPVASHRYAALLRDDLRATSIFHCWRRGKPPTNEDYLYLRSLVYNVQPRDEAAYHFIADILNEVSAHWVADVLAYYFDVFDTSPEFQLLSSQVVEVVSAAISFAIRSGRACFASPTSSLAFAFYRALDWMTSCAITSCPAQTLTFAAKSATTLCTNGASTRIWANCSRPTSRTWLLASA